MRQSILIIGEDLEINREFLNYIFQSYEDHFGELGVVSFAPKNSKELPFIIENLSKDYDFVSIFGSDENFAIAAKIVATLTGGSLELKDSTTLALKDSLDYSKNSFLASLNNAQINLIKANPNEELGEFLTEYEPDFSYFHLIDIDADSAKILMLPLAKTYEVDITLAQILPNLILTRAKSNKFGQIESFLQGVKTLFSQKFIPQKDVIKFVANRLMQKGLKISFAESCTAGLAAAKFARYGGVSASFDGSLVTYANHIKHEWLGVEDEILDTYGAVSEPCVKAMVKGTLSTTNADFALAISGIAGPGGGTASKPVGTVYVAAGDRNGNIEVERLLLKGDRNYVREQSVLSAYLCLLRLKSEIFFA